MASRPEENLYCPICLKIFQDPVLVSCTHSFCKACLQKWWTEKTILECPLCKRRSLDKDPPQNLALKNLCEALLLEGTERLSIRSEALCSLHSENLRLFCLDHQQLLCVICLHSETHNTHTIRPIEEAARDCKEGLQEFLPVLREKLEHFKETKGNLDQTAQKIEVQAQDTERQIKDVFLMLQKFLKEEEEARISAVREEKNQKSEMMKTESEALSRGITDLSDTIRVADDVLQAEDISFLQSYNTTAELVQNFQLDVPQKTPEALIDVDKHLNNLSFKILDSIKKKVSPTQPPKPPPYHKPLQPYYKPPPPPPPPLPAPKTSKATLVEELKRLNVELMNKNRYKETGLFGTSQGGAVSRKPLNREPPSCNTRVISKKNPVPRSYDPRYQGFAFPPTASSYYFGYPYDIPPLPQLPTLPTLPTSYYSSNTGYSPWR